MKHRTHNGPLSHRSLSKNTDIVKTIEAIRTTDTGGKDRWRGKEKSCLESYDVYLYVYWQV